MLDGVRRAARAAFSVGFVPAVLTASILSWVFHAQIEQWLREHSYRMDATTAVFLLLLGAIWVAEQVYPARPEWNYRLLSPDWPRGWSRLFRDLLYLFVVTQVTALLIRVVSDRVTPMLSGVGKAHGVWPSGAPFPLLVVLAFLLVELLSYWMHRASHRFSLFWRFHGTHHVTEELTGFASLRVHPIDNVLFYLARSLPLMLLGAGSEEMIAVTYFGSVLGLLSHANIRVSEGPLGWFVNFPGYHAVHHSIDVAEANSNFGCHTVLWDRVFGTFRSGSDRPLSLGVAPAGRRTLWQELVRPFYRASP